MVEVFKMYQLTAIQCINPGVLKMSGQPIGASGSGCVEKKQQITITLINESITNKNDTFATYLLNLSETVNNLSVKMTGNQSLDRSELMAQLGRDQKDHDEDDSGPETTGKSFSFDELLGDYERRISVFKDIISTLQQLMN